MSSHVNPDGPLPLTSNMEKKLVDVSPLKWRPLVMQLCLSPRSCRLLI